MAFKYSFQTQLAPRYQPADELELVLGAGRGALGPELDSVNLGPESALEMVCGFCAKILLVINEAGVPFTYYIADISTPEDKPEWLERVNPKKECPVARLPGETEWVSGSDQIPQALAAVDSRVAEVMGRKRRADDGTAVSAEDERFLKTFVFIWITATLSPPEMTVDEALEKGGMIVFMLNTIGVDREKKETADAGAGAGAGAGAEAGTGATSSSTNSGGSSHRVVVSGDRKLRQVAAERAVAYLNTLERVTSVQSSATGATPPFLSGDKPGVIDFWIAPDLVTLLEPAFPKFLAAHGINLGGAGAS